MGKNNCGRHRFDWWDWKCFRHYLLIGFLVLCVVVGIIVLIVFLVLRPSKPSFDIHEASVLGLDLSHPNLLSSTFQVTLFSRNPNDRIGVYYDYLAVHAAYGDQQITVSTLLPPTYQGTKDVSVWSPFLHGTAVPMASYVSESLAQQEFSGILPIHFKIDGRVRWKVGTWRSGTYRLHVVCPVLFHYGGAEGTPEIRVRHMSHCHVDV